MTQPEIWTIGHWNLPIEEFLRPLREAHIDLVADVRSLPGSRRSPQFDREAMSSWLGDAGIAYVHLGDLGGRRHRQDVDQTVNAGWHNASFKNYADYALGANYLAGIEHLEHLASEQRAAVVCGEPVPWRCHRSLIADSLVVRGWIVWHLLHDAAPVRHELGRWGAAPLVDEHGRITYPSR